VCVSESPFSQLILTQISIADSSQSQKFKCSLLPNQCSLLPHNLKITPKGGLIIQSCVAFWTAHYLTKMCLFLLIRVHHSQNQDKNSVNCSSVQYSELQKIGMRDFWPNKKQNKLCTFSVLELPLFVLFQSISSNKIAIPHWGTTKYNLPDPLY